MVFELDGGVGLIVELASCILVSEEQKSIESYSNVRAELACRTVCLTVRTLKLASLNRTRIVGTYLASIYSQTSLSSLFYDNPLLDSTDVA